MTPVGGAYKNWAWIAFGINTEGTSCQIGGTRYEEGSWQQWRDGKTVEFTVLSYESNGQGTDKIERCYPKFHSKFWLHGVPSSKPEYYWSDAKP